MEILKIDKEENKIASQPCADEVNETMNKHNCRFQVRTMIVDNVYESRVYIVKKEEEKG